MLLKTGEKQKALGNAETLKLKEEFDTVKYNWEESKKIFRKVKIDRESYGIINQTNYMNRRPRSTDKRSFYRESKSGSRSRERRFSTPNFKPRSNSRSREHEAGSSLKNEVKEMNSKV